MMNRLNNSGFTLLEVLVASVIMISSVAAISMAYRGAFIASEKADNHVKITTVVPAVLSEVREEIQKQGQGSSSLQGDGTSWGISYNWQAQMVRLGGAPERYDPDSDEFETGEDRFRLWQVELVLQSNGIEQHYTYREVSWDEVR